MSAIANIPLRVHSLTAEEIAEWSQWEDRVSCGDCARRSRDLCAETRKTHVPLGLLHRCEWHRATVRKP